MDEAEFYNDLSKLELKYRSSIDNFNHDAQDLFEDIQIELQDYRDNK